MIDENGLDTLAKSYIYLVEQGAHKIHLECVFSDKKWTDVALRELEYQIQMIVLYDQGKRLVKYPSHGVYDVSTDGRIERDSLSFHGNFNMEAKKYLDLFLSSSMNE